METYDMVQDFESGVNAYFSGECPDNWNNKAMRERSPFLSGWYMASMTEVGEDDWLILEEDL